MTRWEMSEWWTHKGTAWASIDAAERALLEAQHFQRADPDLDRVVRHAIGCLAGAREMLAIATEFVEAAAKKLGRQKEGGPL